MDIPYFRGVFMRNSLPPKPQLNESAIVNLDDSNRSGTHWVAYRKLCDDITYFDSFGNLKPPIEILKYFYPHSVKYNYESYQTFNTFNCGHLCLKFLCQII